LAGCDSAFAELGTLDEQERQVLHDLTAVVAECDRAFAQMQTNMNRYLAASDALAVLEANRKAGMPVNSEQLLDSQRRMSDAQSRYFLSMAEHTLAIKNVQFEKGTLLHAVNLGIVDQYGPASDAIKVDDISAGLVPVGVDLNSPSP
jgi:hypothetical protein